MTVGVVFGVAWGGQAHTVPLLASTLGSPGFTVALGSFVKFFGILADFQCYKGGLSYMQRRVVFMFRRGLSLSEG